MQLCDGHRFRRRHLQEHMPTLVLRLAFSLTFKRNPIINTHHTSTYTCTLFLCRGSDGHWLRRRHLLQHMPTLVLRLAFSLTLKRNPIINTQTRHPRSHKHTHFFFAEGLMAIGSDVATYCSTCLRLCCDLPSVVPSNGFPT